ncbi:hypothetical protein BGZ61DRAFT_368571 [Ilyonectria robusta]|uniref:uncharacterized protein n=1 Tax=Ilyonectria robusta TaxID=1079257 RepID=UPI001E8E1CFF|nr:uncharacterized protein BGZ61DRAFT_368571 [Ilyonectria robusta]KAH8662719.1 hypothetical protein BGZ61DRAFT_368571 [Ilyonectria robusta]
MPRNNYSCQPIPSQGYQSSFFEAAIDALPASIEDGLASLYDSSPILSTEPKMSQDNETAPYKSPPSVTRVSPGSSKQKKRGRKPKKQLKDEKGQKNEPNDDNLPKDPRRRRILERNRIAATKCRLRKLDETSALASREQAIEEQNRYLSACYESLTAEIYHLKTQLLRHTDCNCVLIQKYIANEAKNSVDALLACSSGFQPFGGFMSPSYASSSGSSIGASFNIHCPEADSFPPSWTNNFQRGPGEPEVRDDIFGMGLEPFGKAAMTPDCMISTQPTLNPPFAGCGSGVFLNMGLQEQQTDDFSPGIYWAF